MKIYLGWKVSLVLELVGAEQGYILNRLFGESGMQAVVVYLYFDVFSSKSLTWCSYLGSKLFSWPDICQWLTLLEYFATSNSHPQSNQLDSSELPYSVQYPQLWASHFICRWRSLPSHRFLSCPSKLSALVAPFALISNSLIFFSNPSLFAINPPRCSSNCAIFSAGVASRCFSASCNSCISNHSRLRVQEKKEQGDRAREWDMPVSIPISS
jgi:hypothetical protein